MKIDQLDNLEALEQKQIKIMITGEVQESNFKEFESQALTVLAGINRKLETDEDFAEAEQNVKFCKLIANRIATERNSALAQTKAISDLIATTSRVESKFDEVRLILTKLVGSEKERRRNEIINGAQNRLNGLLLLSPVKHGFAIDHKEIIAATKGKRSLSKMQEAVDSVVAAEELRLADMEVNYLANIDKINASEENWPGLFPDKQNVAITAPATVDAIIVGRVADHRMRVAEKAKKEQEAREAARIREEPAEAIQKTVLPDLPELPPMPDDPFLDLPYPLQKKYVITVITQSDAVSPAIMADILSDLHGVIEVTVASE